MPEMDPNQQTLNAAAAAEAEDTNGLYQQQTPQQRSQEAAEEGNNNGLHQLQITQQKLNKAAEDGNINGLYGCINDHPHILDGIDKIPFVDTPLHIAVSAGHAHFALEMMRLMPSFSRKLNPQGLSPLDLALRKREVLRRNLEDFPLLNMEEELSNLKKLTRTIRQLINFEKELIGVKGRESVTPLHYVAEKGDIELLAEFLCARPESILDRTIRDETALHIALKNSKPKAFEVLLGCLQRIQKCHVLDWKDDEGNTLLHIAVSTSQTQIVKSLLNIVTVNKNVKNLEGQTALDIATTVVNLSEAKREIKEALDHAGASKSTPLPEDCSFAEFFMSPQRRIEVFTRLQFYQGRKLTMEMRNAMLVVAVLIATATFQAILSPPGGVVRGTGDNNNQLTNNENHINATIMSTTTTNNLIPTNNVSYINATIFTNATTTNPTATMDPSKLVLLKKTKTTAAFTYGSFFADFYFLNTVCFITSVGAIMFILPSTLFSAFLYTPLLYLMLSYGISFLMISPSSFYGRTFYSVSCTFSVLVCVLWAVVRLFKLRDQSQRLQMLLYLLERS